MVLSDFNVPQGYVWLECLPLGMSHCDIHVGWLMLNNHVPNVSVTLQHLPSLLYVEILCSLVVMSQNDIN